MYFKCSRFINNYTLMSLLFVSTNFSEQEKNVKCNTDKNYLDFFVNHQNSSKLVHAERWL